MKPKHINIWTKTLYLATELKFNIFSQDKIEFNNLYSVKASAMKSLKGLGVDTNSVNLGLY